MVKLIMGLKGSGKTKQLVTDIYFTKFLPGLQHQFAHSSRHIRPAASVRIQDGASKKTFTAASRAAAARRNAARSRAERKNFCDDCALLCSETVEKSR